MIEWEIKGRELANCNCDYGCPCQFNALPTKGFCEAIVGVEIDEGHFGDVELDGMRCAGVYAWPGPVHGGDGRMQLIVDESATPAQRNALIPIMLGEETEPMATMWAVYTSMCTKRFDALFKPIELEIDVQGRVGRIVVPGVFETEGEPIRNPVTNEVHRARIDLPNGFEYRLAEMGSASTRATGEIKLDLSNSHAQFADLHLCNSGIAPAVA